MLTLVPLLIGILESGPHPSTPPLTVERLASRQVAPSADGQDCVAFSSGGRLGYGTSFVARLPRGLELRFRPDGDFGWSIAVGRPGGTLDYMWVVSPPFQTAPQRQIGPVHGLTARESASFERRLRFVLTDAEYNAALKNVRDDVAASEKMAKIERLGRGRLTIAIGRFGLRKAARQEPVGEVLDWIEFKGEACVPRR
jgi:hypothetical protein